MIRAMESHIDIKRQHALSPDEARNVIDHLAENLQNKFGVTPSWRGDTLHFARSGVNGFIAVSDDEVHVNATLGPFLAPLRSTVEAEIMRKLDKYFPLSS